VHENWAFLKAYFAYLKKLPSVGGGHLFMYKKANSEIASCIRTENCIRKSLDWFLV
jgi:hypothetical protein